MVQSILYIFVEFINLSPFIRFFNEHFRIPLMGYAPLAQLVEQLTLNQWVRSSSLRWCTKVGVTIAQGPPVPIPNTEVKLCGAENTCLATSRENRSLLTLEAVT